MSPTNYQGDIIPQDTAEDDSSLETGAGQPLSEAEIEELLYGEGRPVAERLRLLRALRNDLAAREEADFGDDDPGELIDEIDERVSRAPSRRRWRHRHRGRRHRSSLRPSRDRSRLISDLSSKSSRKKTRPRSTKTNEWLDKEDEGDLDNDDDVSR